jgi:acetylglutamate kinase
LMDCVHSTDYEHVGLINRINIAVLSSYFPLGSIPLMLLIERVIF